MVSPAIQHWFHLRFHSLTFPIPDSGSRYIKKAQNFTQRLKQSAFMKWVVQQK
ncbi:hypothetical protein Hanom_Chr08g00684141 [Helianthus anomalus]